MSTLTSQQKADFSQYLREHLEIKTSISQEELARRAKMSAAYIMAMRNGSFKHADTEINDQRIRIVEIGRASCRERV